MKFIIWIGCAFLWGVINATLSFSGVSLGGIPAIIIAGILIFVATKMCEKWDKQKEVKTHQESESFINLNTSYFKNSQYKNAIPAKTETRTHTDEAKTKILYIIIVILLMIGLIAVIVAHIGNQKDLPKTYESETTASDNVLIEVKAISRIISNGNIGNNWTKKFILTGAELQSEGKYWCSAGDTITFTATITEHDVNDDIGKTVSSLIITEEDIKNGFTFSQTIEVYENDGQNISTTKKTTWIVTYIIQPVN